MIWLRLLLRQEPAIQGQFYTLQDSFHGPFCSLQGSCQVDCHNLRIIVSCSASGGLQYLCQLALQIILVKDTECHLWVC